MCTIGVDLGGTNIAVGVVEAPLKILGKASVKTGLPATNEEICQRIIKAIELALSNSDKTLDDIEYVGIGSPGAVDNKNGVVISASNLKFREFPLSKAVSEALEKPVYLENDANAAALGEYIASGVSEEENSLIAVTLGTGIGGGIIIDGKLYCGHKFSGGELGHMVINAHGEKCACGRRGCFEAYASVSALIEQTIHSMLKNKDSKMWQAAGGSLDNVNGKTAFDALRLGDEAAAEVVDTYADWVAIGIVNLINTFGPSVICISGGISKEGETLLGPIREHIRLNHPVNCQTEIRAAVLNNDAGIIGAANLLRFGQ